MSSQTARAADCDLGWWEPAPGDPSLLARTFGVRHLSPAAAYHLTTVLDALRPTAVLVEGPADATEHIKHLAHDDTRPPIALLAYTEARPVRSILYPLAEYSPEWAALTWGLRNKAEVRFIDLPAAVFLELHQLTSQPEEEDDGETPAKHGRRPASTRAPTSMTLTKRSRGSPASRITRRGGSATSSTPPSRRPMSGRSSSSAAACATSARCRTTTRT